MPAIVVPANAPSLGPGYAFRAPLGSVLPTNTVVAGVFTDAWGASWIPWGVSRGGIQFTYETSTEDVVVAEYLDPLMTVPTGRNIGVAIDVAQITNRNLMAALNGGTSSVVSGTGATTLTSVEPPALGAEVRQMFGWESQDGTMRYIYRQTIQSGSVQWSAAKAPDYMSFPMTLKVEQPAAGAPFTAYFAGTNRIQAA